jgi:hypothetical protein
MNDKSTYITTQDNKSTTTQDDTNITNEKPITISYTKNMTDQPCNLI